jgi:hypothetical protein
MAKTTLLRARVDSARKHRAESAGGGEDIDRYGRFENHHRIWRVGSKTPVIEVTTGV